MECKSHILISTVTASNATSININTRGSKVPVTHPEGETNQYHAKGREKIDSVRKWARPAIPARRQGEAVLASLFLLDLLH
jgi:hypothetical protein